MANDWIIDVLSDLQAFATKNDLTVLSEHLDEAKLIAAAEISSVEARETGPVRAGAKRTGNLHWAAPASGNA